MTIQNDYMLLFTLYLSDQPDCI